MGLAYRLLGSISDAQDVVQDTYLKWITYKGVKIDTPPAWLSRVCTNRCLDLLKSANSTRVDYVGQWIPEQLQTEFESTAEEQMEIASTLTTAFLILLERLTPKERAAYLLHDIFAKSFDEVAQILELKPSNCRKLASRARKFVAENNVRHIPDEKHQQNLLTAFKSALLTGDTNELGHLLRADSDLRADSGGKVRAILDVLEGQETICDFIGDVLKDAWSNMRVSSHVLNGTLGLFIADEAELHAAISFGYDQNGKVAQIYIMRHPDKLAQLREIKSHVTGSGSIIIQ